MFWNSAIIFWQQPKSYGLNLANLTFFSLKYGDFVPFLLKKSLGKTGGLHSAQRSWVPTSAQTLSFTLNSKFALLALQVNPGK
jgi:hypothetical protein